MVRTPGRLRDQSERGALDMSALRAVVLDEADEMLDFGFREDLEYILDAAPASRRTLLFSATVPRAIADIARRFQKDALRISTVSERGQHADIEYRALSVAPSDRENAIINVLRYYDAERAMILISGVIFRLSTAGAQTASGSSWFCSFHACRSASSPMPGRGAYSVLRTW